jgi:NTP pyrophosphatase (non-canonical NTP hydrolase)
VDIEKITDILRRFRDDREDWPAKHTLRNLVIALNVEASELLLPLQWIHDHQVEEWLTEGNHREHLADEVADIFIYLTYIADHLHLDLESAVMSKIERNASRFPKNVIAPPASADQGESS